MEPRWALISIVIAVLTRGGAWLLANSVLAGVNGVPANTTVSGFHIAGVAVGSPSDYLHFTCMCLSGIYALADMIMCLPFIGDGKCVIDVVHDDQQSFDFATFLDITNAAEEVMKACVDLPRTPSAGGYIGGIGN